VVAHECLAEARAAAALEDTADTRAALSAAQATVDAYGALREVLATGRRARDAAEATWGCLHGSYSGCTHEHCTPTTFDTQHALTTALGSGASSEKVGAWAHRIGDPAYGASLESRADATWVLKRRRRAADVAHIRELASQAASRKARATYLAACVNYTETLARAVQAHPSMARTKDGRLPRLSQPLTPAERALLPLASSGARPDEYYTNESVSRGVLADL